MDSNDPEAKKPLFAIIGEIRVLPFRNTELPNGWYYANGDKFALTTPQGTVLNVFSTTFKNDWGITSTEVNGVATINIPNLFASDGTGATLIPCNGTSLPIGGIQEDAGRNATGSCDAVMNFVNIGGCWSNSNYAPNSQAASPAYGFHGLIMDLSRAWGAAHTSAVQNLWPWCNACNVFRSVIMMNHYYDEQGYYGSSTEFTPGTMPP